ncbi:hypothetical protein PVAP13_2KG216930, partial [Panicum virgatum]
LPPTSTADPAATPLSPTLPPSPAATLTTSPARGTPELRGRSKAQRWVRDSPPTGKSGGATPISFKEALLLGIAARASPQSPRSTPRSSPRGSRPRIVVRDAPRQRRSPATVPDTDGWVTAVCRKSRLAVRRAERRPPRPVPVDLRGKCFNCFSPWHRASSCKSSTRCFICHKSGHRSYICPSRGGDVYSHGCPGGSYAGYSGRRRARKRSRRGGHGQPSSNSNPGDLPSPASSDDDHLITDAGHSLRPRRVIQRSSVIAQREELLAERALVLSVVADDPGGLFESILPAIAQRFEIEERSLSLSPLGLASLLLISPDEQSASRILNDGRALIIPACRIHAKRWTRFLSSTAGNLPCATEIELRGIPAHAWDVHVDTASQLLNDCCLPCGILPGMEGRRDVLRLRAWCSSPRDIPPEMDL